MGGRAEVRTIDDSFVGAAPPRRPFWRVVRLVGGVAGVATLLLVVVAGFLGSSSPTANPAQIIAWIYLWPGLLVLSALAGDVWELLNPWSAVHRALTRWLGSPRPRELPAGAGVWPAAVLFVAFACFELTTGLADVPVAVAAAAVAYTAVALAGMTVLGRDAWLARCDPLTVVLRLAGRIGPLALVGEPRVRRYGAGLLEPALPAGWSWTALVLLALAAVLFDALLPTSTWQSVASGIGGADALVRGSTAFVLVRTAALAAIALVVAALFLGAISLTPRSGGSRLAVATAFAIAIAPAVVALHAAHNWEYLTVESQRLLPLLADPLDRGWRLVPTGGPRPNPLPGSVTIAWPAGVALVALGFGGALAVAHRAARGLFRRRFDAVTALYPFAVFLLIVATAGLLILAQGTFRT